MLSFRNIFFFLTIIIFPSYASGALLAEVLPCEVKPGDVFIIKSTDAKISRLPSATLDKNKFHFSSCGKGCFIAIGAVDVKTKPGDYKIKVRAGKQKINLKISIKQIDFETCELTLPDNQVFLNPHDLKRVKMENKKLKSIFQKVSRKRWEGDFIFPIENDIVIEFGVKRIINGEFTSIHRGIDIRGEEGDEIVASNNGRVVLAKNLFFGGNTVILDHGHGIYTIYMHLTGFKVKPKTIVKKGEVIGYVGSTGRSTGPHLHFGVRIQNMNVNPVSLIELEL